MFNNKIFTFFLLFIVNIKLIAQEAFIIKPVVDCTSQALSRSHSPNVNVKKIYHEMPISWAGTKENIMLSCPRIHQLLFNETVSIIAECGDEVLVEIPQMFSETLSDNKHCNRFWTLKKNLQPLDTFHSKKQISAFIPEPVSYKKPFEEHKDIITLKFPWYDQVTAQTYSAGTRFVVEDHHEGYYIIQLYNTAFKTPVWSKVPTRICANKNLKSPQQKIKEFVKLLRQWTLFPQGSIPLVWGGVSLTNWNVDDTFYKKHKILSDGTVVEYWQSAESQIPHTGFDSSGLILRAAQICGIPYFFKNTTTAAKYLQTLDKKETLEEGDLLWVPGGLLVISNLPKNRILAAIGYQFGYGKVVELELEKLFFNISTYQELIDAYFQQKPLNTKKADGSPSRTIETYSIFKMQSTWKAIAKMKCSMA